MTLNDTEIIKVLEICLNKSGGCISAKCPLVNDLHCKELLISRCFEIINRQQAEINQFAEANKMVVETDKTEDEILKKLLTQRVEFIPNTQNIEDIKREAVREFANKLKEQAFECDISFGLGSQHVKKAVAVVDIDNLVAEMFGNPEQQKGE